MHATSRDHARRIWHQLAARHRWQLFDDQRAEDGLLDQVLAASTANSDQIPTEQALRAAIQRCYSERLYQGMAKREERAATELWLMFLRLAIRDEASEHDAQDIAQEAVTRVLHKLDQVHSPQQFLAWTLKVFRTTQRDLRPKRTHVSLTPATDAMPALEEPDPSDVVAEIEQRILGQALREQLRATLPNNLERLTLLRCVLLDADPRDVARDLGLPLYRTRTAKSRALQRLRASPVFMTWLSSYIADENDQPPSGGSDYA